MYTRDFGTQDATRSVPDSYCGNLFSEEKEEKIHNDAVTEECAASPSVVQSLFGKTFDFKKLSFFKKGFGTEEILILGIAAFLLFSKDGDKESAIILLLSLFLF